MANFNEEIGQEYPRQKTAVRNERNQGHGEKIRKP